MPAMLELRHLIWCRDLINLCVCVYMLNLLGIEARGFIFGPAIALAIGAKFIPLRKPGKLPGKNHILLVTNLPVHRGEEISL